MPLFTASSPYDADVERATSELNAEDNVTLFRELSDKIRHAPSPGARDFLRSIVKRINDKNPHVALQALSLLDTSVQRSGYAFHLEMASPDFISECRTLIGSGKPHPKVVKKLKMLIKRWADNEFKTDKALSQMVSLYNGLKSEGHKFNFEDVNISTTSSSTSSGTTKKEQDDLEKAIALSLKESSAHGGPASSLYPSATTSSGFYPSVPANSGPREPRKVRALYDFEAAEDNELTFKGGEIIGVLDDSDVNWWKGVSWRGEGLFPANFVTADLTVEPEPEIYKPRKSVHFHDEVEVKVVEPSVPVLEVDEEKIDAALSLIQNSDPTDPESDSSELLSLEEQCKDMGPLIDQELVKVDREHNSLMESNTKLMDAFQMYHSLMRELPSYGYVPNPNITSSQQAMYANQQYPSMLSGQTGGNASSMASFTAQQVPQAAGQQHTIPSGYGSQNTNSSSVPTNDSNPAYHQSQNFVASQHHSNAPTPPPTVQQPASYNNQQQYMGGAYGAPAGMNYIPSDGYAQSAAANTIQSMSYTSTTQQPITAQSLL